MPLCRLDHEPRHGRRVCEVRARDRERRASAGSPCDLISDVDVALGQPVRLASRWRDLQVVEAASKSQGGRLERGLAQDCGAVGSEGSRLLITLGRKPRTPVSWPSRIVPAAALSSDRTVGCPDLYPSLHASCTTGEVDRMPLRRLIAQWRREARPLLVVMSYSPAKSTSPPLALRMVGRWGPRMA